MAAQSYVIDNGSFESGGDPPTSWTYAAEQSGSGCAEVVVGPQQMVTSKKYDGTRSYYGPSGGDCPGNSGNRTWYKTIKSDSILNIPEGDPFGYITFWANANTGSSANFTCGSQAGGGDNCQFWRCESFGDKNQDGLNRINVKFYNAAGAELAGGNITAEHAGGLAGVSGNHCSNYAASDCCNYKQIFPGFNPGLSAVRARWFDPGAGANKETAMENDIGADGENWVRYTVAIPAEASCAGCRDDDMRIGIAPATTQSWTSERWNTVWIDQVCVSDSLGNCFVPEPDLTPTEIYFNGADIAPTMSDGQFIQLTADIQNVGTAAASSSTTSFYECYNILPGNTCSSNSLIGSVANGNITGGQTVTTPVVWWDTSGQFGSSVWIEALVTGSNPAEANTSNNQNNEGAGDAKGNTAATLTFNSLPNLVVDALLWSPSSGTTPKHGDNVTVTATIRNAGGSATCPSPSTVGLYQFEGNANDGTNNNLDGTLVGGATTGNSGPPGLGNALTLNGTNAYLNLGSSPTKSPLDIPGDMTVMMWFKIKSQKYNVLATRGIGLSNNEWYIRQRGDTTQKIEWALQDTDNDTTGQITTAATFSSTGVWYHVALVRNGTSAFFYVNGSFDSLGSNGALGDISSLDNHKLFIGADTRLSGTHFANVDIDDLRIYDRALSANAVNTIYNSGNSGFPHCSTSTGAADTEVRIEDGGGGVFEDAPTKALAAGASTTVGSSNNWTNVQWNNNNTYFTEADADFWNNVQESVEGGNRNENIRL